MYKRCTGPGDALRLWMICGLGLGLLCTVIRSGALAQETSTDTQEVVKAEADPSGTWKWEREFRDNLLRSTLKVKKADGGKLTGTMQTVFGDGGGPGSDPVEIQNGKIEGEKVTFSVTRNFNGNQFTIDYEGKYVNGELGGTYALDFGNGRQTIEWKAKRDIDLADVIAQPQKLYELRIYETHEGKLPNLQARFRDHTLRLFEKHGMENIVYWTVTEGAKGEDEIKNNLLVYIIAHKDEASREASWKGFISDPEWQQVAAESEKDGPILAKPPRSILMTATDFSDHMQPNKDSGDEPRLFELRQYNDGPERVPSTVDRFASGEKELFTKHGMTTVSFWKADDDSAFIYLLAHKDREASRKSWEGFFSDFRQFMAEYREKNPQNPRPADQRGGGAEVRFLVPTDYSPVK